MLRVHGVEFDPAECMTCGDAVWHWPKLVKPDGQPVDLDLNTVDGNILVAIHQCEYDENEREDGDIRADPGDSSEPTAARPRS